MMSNHIPEVRIFSESGEIVEAVVQLAIARIEQILGSQGIFHLALTGGKLGNLVSRSLVDLWNRDPGKYSGLHLWWSDERFVPDMSDERNSYIVVKELSDSSPIHLHQVLAKDSGVGLDVAARRYNADLFGIDMDLTVLGVGPDGHVASLFPGLWNSSEERDAIAVDNSPKPPPERVSFSMQKICNSESVWFIADGAEKRDAVAKIIAQDRSIPASHAHGKTETMLFVEHSAMQGG